MGTRVTMPMLGLTMEEGTVAEWLKREGDTVAKDEPLLMVEMDKGTVEVPSPGAGVLRRIVVQQGITVPVKTLIAEIGERGEVLTSPSPAPGAGGGSRPSVSESEASGPGDLPSPAALDATPAAVDATFEVVDAPFEGGGRGSAGSPVAATAGRASSVGQPESLQRLAAGDGGGDHRGRLFASPRARMRARALGVELSSVRGSGPHGRIVEADVLGAPDSQARVLATPLARRLAEEHGVEIADLQGTGPGGRITQDDVAHAAKQRTAALALGAATPEQPVTSREAAPAPPTANGPGQPAASAGPTTASPSQPVTPGEGVRPLSRVRRITAERMAASAQASARVTLFREVDFSEASRFREQLQPEFARLGVPKLPWDALLARAAALALQEHPALLAQWVEGEGLHVPNTVDVGVGVALEPEGLVVPVLKDAARRSLRELAADLLSLVDRARASRLAPAEMQGGTFTITNLGAYGIDGFTPILNPPETAILGVGRIAARPVVLDGRIEARTMCTLSLSFDHRVVDGAPAAAFLARLAQLLERPYALLGI